MTKIENILINKELYTIKALYYKIFSILKGRIIGVCNNHVMHVAYYKAPYAGNFILSLEALETELNKKNINVTFVFPEGAKERQWCKRFKEGRNVYFLPEGKYRLSTIIEFKKIYLKVNPSIIHSHFETYDLITKIVAKARTKVIWHMHNGKDIPTNIMGWTKQKLRYGFFGKKTSLIAISKYHKDNVVKMGFPINRSIVILNGIDTKYIKKKNKEEMINCDYTFLMLGGSPYNKGVDIVLDASENLWRRGYKFKIAIVGSLKLKNEIDRRYFSGNIPEWLLILDPIEDVNNYYGKSYAFISASRKETFSYGLCEATYSGLQIISSDIPGVKWAHKIPSINFFRNEDRHALENSMKSLIHKYKENTIPEQTTFLRSHIENNLSNEIWTKHIINFYEKVQNVH